MRDRSLTRPFAPIVTLMLALTSSSCAYTIDWRIEPAEVPLGSTREASSLERYVAITEGDCSTERAILDATNSARLVDGEGFPVGEIVHGRRCFWSIQVRRFEREGVDVSPEEAPCRLEALGSTEATLPADATVVVHEALVFDAMRPRWDAFVRSLAHCAPQRDPVRCACPYSEALGGACGEAVRGSLIAAGPDHVCTALFGASSMTCWGNVQGWTSSDTPHFVGPTLVPAAFRIDPSAPELGGRPILQIDAGPQATCVRVVGGRVRCFGTRGIGYNSASGNLGGGFIDVAVGADFACGIENAGAVCRGGASASVFESALATPGIVDVDAGDAHVCWLANGRAACITAEGTSTCPGCDAPSSQWTQITAAGNQMCGVQQDRLYCWDVGADHIELFSTNTAATHSGAHWVCGMGGAGVSRCGGYPVCGSEHRGDATFAECATALPSTWGLVTLVGNNACASIGDDGSIHCTPLDNDTRDMLLGRIATTTENTLGEETSSVCPYPASLR